MTYHILLGHGPSTDRRYNDVGASGFGDNERDMLRGNLLTSLIKYSKLSKHTIRIHTNNPFRDQIIRSIPSSDDVMELHMDGNVKESMSGGHVIIHTDYRADNTDFRLADLVKKYFGWRVNLNKGNGINGRSDLQNCNQAKLRKVTYRLVELGHISNKQNNITMNESYDSLAKELIEAFTNEKLQNICPTCGQPIGGK